MTDFTTIDVIAPNFKKRLSGVTATVVRLVPIQAREIGIVATGPVLPDHVPQIPLAALITMPRDRLRVWHARRNVEMIAGLALKHLLRKRLKLVFTSASQRQQTGLTRWLIRQMDAVVATSDRTAKYLEIPAQVIMHGIDLDDYAPSPDRAALRAKLGLPNGTLVGCYGRIRHQKGTDAFIEAMLPAMRQHPDLHALVMGRATDKHANYLAELKTRVAAQGDLAARVHFLPEANVEAMADWYRILDLYVAPQRWEGFGLTPIEAMACGVPVVATRVGAFEKIVTPDTGLLVPPDEIDALAAALDTAIAPPEPFKTWSTNARPHVAEHFSIQREANELTTLYRRLLTQS